jgi:TolA-binding protein
MKKITEETTDHVKVLGEIDTKHNTALSEAKEAHRLEKVEIEGKVTAAETKIGELDTQVSGLTGDLETKLAAAQKELEDKTTELQAKIDELTTANTTLTSEKEALELRVNQLAAGKKGLPVPVAVVKDAPQGAAAAAAAAGTVVTTQTGDPNPPVQVISPGTGFQGAMSEEDEEMIEVLTEFDALHTAATNPDAMRKFVAFRNSPKHGCEGCEQDPTHHAKLITKAMSFDHRPRLTSLIISA